MSQSTSVCRHVLLIDDDELIVGSLRHYLVTLGCDVDVAADATTADALMREKNYDVVLLDPYLTGALHDERALLDSVGALQPRASTIVLTAYVSPALNVAVGKLQSAAVLSKPQSIVTLSELVAGVSSRTLPSASSTLTQRMIE
jgi:DNA-binding NtrC family response regulator